MKYFEFTTGHDGQGRVKAVADGNGHLFHGTASFGEFGANLDALIADLDGRIRKEAQRYFEELDKDGGWPGLPIRVSR